MKERIESPATDDLLRVENLQITFKTEEGVVTAVSGVSFTIQKGKITALVGESGCGKSVTALALQRLLAGSTAGVSADTLELVSDNAVIDLFHCSEGELRKIRGNRIGMVFQEPMTSLNPTLSIGRQITEVLRLHKNLSGREADEKAVALLREVGMAEPERQLRVFPHQLSGGMRQRVMIAMALACRPDLLIADEPTTALDVTIQAQIMELIEALQQKNNMAVLLITHNMGIVAEMADMVAVMYAGQIVEMASCRDIFTDTRHPYTRALLESVPNLTGEKKKIFAIAGAVPSPGAWPDGCRFHPRCTRCHPSCAADAQALREISPGHFVRCALAEDAQEKQR